MAQVTIYNVEGAKTGELEIDPNLLDKTVRRGLLKEALIAHLASQRQGTHATKNRGMVAGGGKKPWAQKGTGRARQGSTRASHWVGGGKAMGPKPRDYTYRPPRQVRRAGIAAGISLRAKEKNLIIVNEFASDGKTRAAEKSLTKNLKLTNALVVAEKANVKLHRAVRNLASFDAIAPEGINLESVLRHKTLVLTQAAAKAISEALVKPRGKAKA